MSDRDAIRFSDEDKANMTARVAETMRGWSTHGDHYTPTESDAFVLERIAAHAIGCSFDDLRDSELAEIRSLVASAIDDAIGTRARTR